MDHSHHDRYHGEDPRGTDMKITSTQLPRAGTGDLASWRPPFLSLCPLLSSPPGHGHSRTEEEDLINHSTIVSHRNRGSGRSRSWDMSMGNMLHVNLSQGSLGF